MELFSDKTLKALPKASILEATTDVALLLDGDGVIIEVMVAAQELNSTINESWKGRHWGDTVSKESQPKIKEMLSSDAGAPNQQWRQVNHPTRSGSTDLPVRYRTFKLGKNKFVSLGRDLTPIATLQQQLISAQQVAEQDYWKLRQAESKYRLLFQNALEAVLVIDAESGQIKEVNPSAMALMNWSHAPDNRSLWSVFGADSEVAARELLASSAANGRAKTSALRLENSNQPLVVSAALLRQGNTAIHIVHLHTAQNITNVTQRLQNSSSAERPQPLPDFCDSMPDGFVITDPSGKIKYANRAFADMAQLANADLALGAPLSNWLGRANVDLDVLLTNLEQTDRVRFFQTELTSDHDIKSDTEVSAAKLTYSTNKSGAPSAADAQTAAQAGAQAGALVTEQTEEVAYGFVIRQANQRGTGSEIVSNRSVEELTDLVGRVPLKELVKESAELIERLSIEAALQLTQNNRAAAAEMLGLSRQSLYVKMRLYDIADKQGNED